VKAFTALHCQVSRLNAATIAIIALNILAIRVAVYVSFLLSYCKSPYIQR